MLFQVVHFASALQHCFRCSESHLPALRTQHFAGKALLTPTPLLGAHPTEDNPPRSPQSTTPPKEPFLMQPSPVHPPFPLSSGRRRPLLPAGPHPGRRQRHGAQAARRARGWGRGRRAGGQASPRRGGGRVHRCPLQGAATGPQHRREG